MAENFDVFDFELFFDQIATIDALDRGPDGRVAPTPTATNASDPRAGQTPILSALNPRWWRSVSRSTSSGWGRAGTE
jgi:hypothetical protein